MRSELTDYEWVSIKAFLPNKPARLAACERPARVLNGIFLGLAVRW
jgi:transposase